MFYSGLRSRRIHNLQQKEEERGIKQRRRRRKKRKKKKERRGIFKQPLSLSEAGKKNKFSRLNAVHRVQRRDEETKNARRISHTHTHKERRAVKKTEIDGPNHEIILQNWPPTVRRRRRRRLLSQRDIESLTTYWIGLRLVLFRRLHLYGRPTSLFYPHPKLSRPHLRSSRQPINRRGDIKGTPAVLLMVVVGISRGICRRQRRRRRPAMMTNRDYARA